MITVLLIVLAGAVGAFSGALFCRSVPTPMTDAALGVVGFASFFYAQLHWMGAPLVLVPLSVKSLLGAVLLPVAHQALRR